MSTNSFSQKNILEFINTKKESMTKINPHILINYYLKIIKKSVLQLKTIVQSRNYSLLCIEIISNIFWILINYTYNIKLTLFLCDRAILLFNEYLDMFLSTLSIKEIENKININDLKLFIYSKTIGPLELYQYSKKQKHITRHYQLIYEVCSVLKNHIKQMILFLQNVNHLQEVHTILVSKTLLSNQSPFDKLDIWDSMITNYPNLELLFFKSYKHIIEPLRYIFNTNQEFNSCSELFTYLETVKQQLSILQTISQQKKHSNVLVDTIKYEICKQLKDNYLINPVTTNHLKLSSKCLPGIVYSHMQDIMQ